MIKEIKYIDYDYKNCTYVRTKYRAGNQANEATLKRIRERLVEGFAYYDIDVNFELTNVQRLFVDVTDVHGKFQKPHSLTSNKMNIVHTIAISVIVDALVSMLNDPYNTSTLAKSIDFADALLSTEDDEGRKKFFNFLISLPKEEDIKCVLGRVNSFVEHWNRASRNLCAGHASTNQTIKAKLDPQLRKVKDEVAATPHTEELRNKFNRFSGTDYKPYYIVVGGITKPISSSVGMEKKDAGYSPGIFLPAIPKRTIRTVFDKGRSYFYHCYFECLQRPSVNLKDLKKLDDYRKLKEAANDLNDSFPDSEERNKFITQLGEFSKSLESLCKDNDTSLPIHDWVDEDDEVAKVERNVNWFYETYGKVMERYEVGGDPLDMSEYDDLCEYAEWNPFAKVELANLQIKLEYENEEGVVSLWRYG